ncbi:hypothetical protein ACX0G9_22120 [Flavitalea flava]
MRLSLTILSILTGFSAFCQPTANKLTGEYANYPISLKLRPDNTFIFKTNDPVFPYTYSSYQNQGTWTASGNLITLNPGKTKRSPSVTLIEHPAIGKEQEGIRTPADSICIRINYFIETYENEILTGRAPADFHLMTLYINNSHNYQHLVHSPIRSVCTFSPRIKRQIILDSSNTVMLPRQLIEKIGIRTYAFDKTIELIPSNPSSSFFEINIIQPVDKERTPRSKQVIIKGNRAYVDEINGKVCSSWYIQTLKKVN